MAAQPATVVGAGAVGPGRLAVGPAGLQPVARAVHDCLLAAPAVLLSPALRQLQLALVTLQGNMESSWGTDTRTATCESYQELASTDGRRHYHSMVLQGT